MTRTDHQADNAYRMVGIFHGRPASIAASDVDADLPNEFAELQIAEGHTDVVHFRMFIQLIKHLENFLGDV